MSRPHVAAEEDAAEVPYELCHFDFDSCLDKMIDFKIVIKFLLVYNTLCGGECSEVFCAQGDPAKNVVRMISFPPLLLL